MCVDAWTRVARAPSALPASYRHSSSATSKIYSENVGKQIRQFLMFCGYVGTCHISNSGEKRSKRVGRAFNRLRIWFLMFFDENLITNYLLFHELWDQTKCFQDWLILVSRMLPFYTWKICLQSTLGRRKDLNYFN